MKASTVSAPHECQLGPHNIIILKDLPLGLRRSKADKGLLTFAQEELHEMLSVNEVRCH